MIKDVYGKVIVKGDCVSAPIQGRLGRYCGVVTDIKKEVIIVKHHNEEWFRKRTFKVLNHDLIRQEPEDLL
jgi:hypothetical protein